MSEREEEAEVYLSVRGNEEDVSSECLAWADSCINSFPDDSDNTNWGNFRDALTEIIDIHPEIFVPSSRSVDEEMIETEASYLRSFSSNEEASESEIISLITFDSNPSLQDYNFIEAMAENGRVRKPTIRKTVDNLATTIDDLEGVERIEEDGSVSDGEAEEELASLLSLAVKDDYMSMNIQDDVEDCNVLEEPVKETPQEIFKVWNLDVAGDDDEGDGFALQLNKALDASSTVQSLPQPLNDDEVVAEKSSIDDLIAGISDLSLAETFK